jgi:hypothetical protein
MNSVTEEESDLDVVMIKHISTKGYEYQNVVVVAGCGSGSGRSVIKWPSGSESVILSLLILIPYYLSKIQKKKVDIL